MNIPESLDKDTLREVALLKENLRSIFSASLPVENIRLLDGMLHKCISELPPFDRHGLPYAVLTLDHAWLFASEVDADVNVMLAILLECPYKLGHCTLEWISANFGKDVAGMVEGMHKVYGFDLDNRKADMENMRGLLISLAGDIRIVIALIVGSLTVMRRINGHPDTLWVENVAREANVLYAQLAHRLGLYGIKSTLEDLSMKYTNRGVYKEIARKLNETKKSRDEYIRKFIEPVKERLEKAGLRFTIKGRTKSISSIWHKIVTKKVDMNHIFDLFAIRVIIDTPPEREQQDCWRAYAILSNMYESDPTRMRDWLSFPKSNGYESLHITVKGPQGKWVEVQFRSKRMDLVAEKGMAAHWRYKGGKSAHTDKWISQIRDLLESSSEGKLARMREVQPGESGADVYAFTPAGDLLCLRSGSTLLDFAFAVHSQVGCRCTGGEVNGRYQKLSYKVKSGDTIKVLTSPSQTPKYDWLSMVRTSKARSKIRQSLDDEKRQKAELGKEMLMRRLKNRKIEIDEAELTRIILKEGYKFANDFMADVADEKVDLNKFLEKCRQLAESDAAAESVVEGADKFRLQRADDQNAVPGNYEELVIGHGTVRGLRYRFSKCCTPLPGDPVFGFISNEGTVNIHRVACPNAADIKRRFPYRIIAVRWSGAAETDTVVTLRVVGRDDIGIVTNITSIIDREKNVTLQSVTIDSHEGLFYGYLGLRLTGDAGVGAIIKKLKTVKGVKNVTVT